MSQSNILEKSLQQIEKKYPYDIRIKDAFKLNFMDKLS